MILSKSNINELLQSAFDRRKHLGVLTNAMRLVNAQGDGLPGLVLERYNQHFVAQVFESFWLEHTDILVDAVQKFRPKYFILKDRTQSRDAKPEAIQARVLIQKETSQTVVTEYGLLFSVDLNDTLNTGLFLDIRANRSVVGRVAEDMRVLNCFAYTCSFGVHCCARKAKEVVNVDVSTKALNRGQVNYGLNKIKIDPGQFVRAEAGWFLSRAIQKKNSFDLIILDPPSFSRHETKTFAVKKDLSGLISAAVQVLNPSGILFVSTNWSGLNQGDLLAMVTKAAGKRKIQNMQKLGQDSDFSGSGNFKESHLAALLVRL